MADTINSRELWDHVGGDRALMSELLELFRRDYPSQIQAAREALRRADAEGVENVGHSLKGALASLAATVASGLASRLEDTGRSGHLEQTDSILTELEQELSRVTASLDILRQGVSVEDSNCR